MIVRRNVKVGPEMIFCRIITLRVDHWIALPGLNRPESLAALKLTLGMGVHNHTVPILAFSVSLNIVREFTLVNVYLSTFSLP